MKLIYIKSAMEPKNYAALRSLLKKEQAEKIAPSVFKLENPGPVKNYLEREKIAYEIYHEEQNWVREITEEELENAYREAWNNPRRIVEFKQWEKLGLASWKSQEKTKKN